MTGSFPVPLLSVLLTLTLIFTLSEPASRKNGFRPSAQAQILSDTPYEDGSEEDILPGEEKLSSKMFFNIFLLINDNAGVMMPPWESQSPPIGGTYITICLSRLKNLAIIHMEF